MKHTLTIEGTADEIRTALDNLTGRVDAPTVTNETNVAQPAPTQDATKAAGIETTSVAPTTDKSGMPYDEAIHASPPSTKSDGTWKVRKGQADAAKAARAAFRASGGGVTAPVVEQRVETETGGMPGLETGGGMPGMDAPLAEPVSLEKAMAKWSELLQNNTITKEQATAIATQATGIADATKHYATFQTNETARAALYAALTAHENAG